MTLLINVLIVIAFHNMISVVLNLDFFAKCMPYSTRSKNNFIGIICKSYSRTLNVITVTINRGNTSSNTVEIMSF